MNAKHTAIRVDASSQIGTGHFMRCLTLADGLKERGSQIRFISRHLPEYLRSMLLKKGHESVQLDGVQGLMPLDELSHAHWLGVSQAQDAAESIQALSDRVWDWIIVDHYALDARWELLVRQSARRILVIDDIADRRHACDVLLDQNFYADMDSRYTGKVPGHCQLLLGPRYALLREEFRQRHEQVKPRIGPVRRILIFFGGVDTANYTGCAIEALANIGMSDLHVDVVIGAQHPFQEQIESACVEYGFVCHVQTSRMAELMATADLAIGAGGSATWERCCLGLSTLAICVAENQRKQIADAASEGLLYALELNDEFVVTLDRHVRALMENRCLMRFISRNCMRAVDGRGALRVIGNLGCTGIKLRVAQQDDSRNLFEWRNHPNVRAVSRSADAIKWESHQVWFNSALCDPSRVILIGLRSGIAVGVVRFDIKVSEAEVSIYLVPGVDEPGQGRALLQSAEDWIVANRQTINKIGAHVLGGNERSQRLFSGSGYQVESTRYSKRLH